MVNVPAKRAIPLRCFGLLLLASTVIAGCSTVANPALERARKAFELAKADPEVSSNAPVSLYEAEKVLRQAERTWESGGSREEIEHFAYLTNQRVEIARATAERKVAETELLKLSQERERVLLEARSRVAVLALQEAEDRARKASEARQEAEMKAREAAQARQEAEARSREAAQARQEAEARSREAIRSRKEAEEATAKTKQLEEQLAQLKAEHTDRGLVLNLGDVLFEFGKADLKAGAVRNLYPLVTFLKEYPARNVLIEGHTDSVGPEAANLDLSQRRAEAVRSFLVQNGVNSQRITTRGYGEAFPVASNNSDAGRQKNRRVKVVILREGESADKQARTR